MAYRSFWGGSGRLDTHLDTPPSINRRHPVSCLALLEADGALVTKDELMSRVWPGIVVAEENLKVQIFALRKALGEDPGFVRSEFGRGYRLTAAVRSSVAWRACQRPTRERRRSRQGLVLQWISWGPTASLRRCSTWRRAA